ncbi:4566_t:CDS:2 [Entrophospora sp. SA101]|nr:3015_t:CDS:2 [Entrophospora sp. SA101]CAJ0833830.1 4566_t:CDS:2 [Entrophospora sp. SA101]
MEHNGLDNVDCTDIEDVEIEDDLLQYINTFPKTLTSNIRDILNQAHPKLGKTYNSHVVFQYEHVCTTISDWLRLLGSEPNPLTLKNLPESWYQIHVWSRAKKGDEYVRIVGSKIADWSASEAGASWEGEHDTKIMKESGLTLPKTLKDITLNYAKREF